MVTVHGLNPVLFADEMFIALMVLWVKSATSIVLPRGSHPGCINPNAQQEFIVSVSALNSSPLCLIQHSGSVDNSCYKRKKVDKNGNCTPPFPSKTCTAYCEEKVRWFYGQEVPYDGTQCASNSTCTFSDAKTVAVTNEWSFDGGIDIGSDKGPLRKAFNLGASYSYSTTRSTTQKLSQKRPTATFASCGYWTFLPYYIQ